MTSGDRDDELNDPEWQEALAKHALSERFNPGHRGATILEMERGRRVSERHANAAFQQSARDALSRAFNSDHDPVEAERARKEESRAAEIRSRRDEYRNRLPLLNGGQNK